MSRDAAAGADTPPPWWHLALFEGLLPIDRARIPAEAIAGVTLATLAIPEVMGYTQIAGMPVVTGLYTILLPLIAFAILGSSRHLVVGADSATAAILAAGLAGMAATGSAQYVALASLLALMAGALLVAARLLRLGFLADFLSRTVLIGFLTGVGIQVACGQLAGMVGVTKPSGGPIRQVTGVLGDLGSADLTTVAVSASVFVLILGGGRLAPKFPWALFAVVGSIVASSALDLPAHGVSTVGTVPGGLPSISVPDVTWSQFVALLGTAATIFFVILAQSAATSRAYADRFGDRFDENTDLLGLAAASASAGLSGTFVVNGSPTKTAMVDTAGGRSQLAQLFAALVVAIVLVFLTGPLSHLPDAVLASVVFLIAVRLIDAYGIRDIWRRRRIEFWVAIVTAATVVLVGVQQGIGLAMALSVIVHLRHSYRPADLLLAADASGRLRPHPVESGAQAAPGVVVYRFAANLYYANASHLSEQLLALAESEPPPQRIVIEAGSIGDIDYSGSSELAEVRKQLQDRHVTLELCDLQDRVRAELRRDGLLDAIGSDHVFDTVDDAIAGHGR
jgi:sulfate permease, SulP family